MSESRYRTGNTANCGKNAARPTAVTARSITLQLELLVAASGGASSRSASAPLSAQNLVNRSCRSLSPFASMVPVAQQADYYSGVEFSPRQRLYRLRSTEGLAIYS